MKDFKDPVELYRAASNLTGILVELKEDTVDPKSFEGLQKAINRVAANAQNLEIGCEVIALATISSLGKNKSRKRSPTSH